MAGKGGNSKVKGKAKEMAGKVTGDRRREAEGMADQAKGEARKAMGETRDRAHGVQDSVKRHGS
ncbi:CsbD family protein [Streptomyces sp. NPDC058067]|uniref:CsbD family protein n=1 Tax=Streptomyces sp. NPDC058067 TaxID=3346324 RepID=UPI0036EC3A5C